MRGQRRRMLGFDAAQLSATWPGVGGRAGVARTLPPLSFIAANSPSPEGGFDLPNTGLGGVLPRPGSPWSAARDTNDPPLLGVLSSPAKPFPRASMAASTWAILSRRALQRMRISACRRKHSPFLVARILTWELRQCQQADLIEGE